MGRKRFLTIVGSLMIGIVSLIIVYLSLILTNVIVLTQADIEITTADAYKEYDGKPLSNNGWSLSKGVLGQDHIVEMTFTGNQLDAGSSKNTADVRIKTVNGKDVTKNYNITLIPGTLSVSPKPISIQSVSDEKDYDGTTLKNETFEVKTGYVLDNHQIKAIFENEITNAGTIDNVFTARIYDENMRDVTNNYDLNISYGSLTINKRVLEIQSANAVKEYDGKPLENTEFEIINGSVVANQSLVYQALVSITDVSKVENSFSVTILDGKGVDQSKNYDIRYINGSLEVTKRPLRVSTRSAEMTYNGRELSNKEYSLSDLTPILDGHVLIVNMDNCYLTTVGKLLNRPEIAVHDADGNDVTNNYEIDENAFGTLEIKKRVLGVKTESASKYYDGTPLTCDKYAISESSPLPVGHELIIEIVGSITDPGEASNYCYCRVVNAKGEDVTYCFNVFRFYGKLIIKDASTTDVNIKLDPTPEPKPDIPDDYDDPEDQIDITDDPKDLFPEDKESETVMIIQSATSGLVYLRQSSYGDYNGKGFLGNPPAYDGDYVINPIYLTSMVLKENGYQESAISVKILKNNEYYHLPMYSTTAAPFTKNDYFITHEFNVNEAYYLSYINYNYSSGSKVTTTKYAIFEAKYRQFVRDNYLNLPADVVAELNQIIDDNKINRNSSTLVEDVLKFVGSCAKYSMKFPVFPNNCDIGVYFLKEADYGICQHFAAAATILFRALEIPARYTVGYLSYAYANEPTEITSLDAHAWVEIYIDGMGWVTVDPTIYAENADPVDPNNPNNPNDPNDPSEPGPASKVTITVKTQSLSKQYDGTPLDASQEVSIEGGKLKTGHWYEVVVSGSQTEVGRGHTKIESFKIYDSDNKDVTNEYNIKHDLGTLHVYISKVTVKVNSEEKVYDGTPLVPTSYEVIGGLLEGHVILPEDVKFYGELTNVGKQRTAVTYKIRDEKTNEDVSDMYYSVVQSGILEVKPIEIIVEIGSAEKVYDGTPLICHEYVCYPKDPTYDILPDHDINIIFGDSITDIGSADNTAYNIEIIHIGYGDVTSNYKITIIDGTLRVKPN